MPTQGFTQVSTDATPVGQAVFTTPEGGIAIKLTNKTGSASVKGYMVDVSSTTDNAFQLCVVDVPDAIGVVYDAGVADGSQCLVVVAGIADVYYVGSTTRKNLARGFVTGDAGYVSGQALNETMPGAPFATDKHFFEIGHVLENRVGAGLAKTVLHFN